MGSLTLCLSFASGIEEFEIGLQDPIFTPEFRSLSADVCSRLRPVERIRMATRFGNPFATNLNGISDGILWGDPRHDISYGPDMAGEKEAKGWPFMELPILGPGKNIPISFFQTLEPSINNRSGFCSKT